VVVGLICALAAPEMSPKASVQDMARPMCFTLNDFVMIFSIHKLRHDMIHIFQDVLCTLARIASNCLTWSRMNGL
jgi:hypothetical protein